MRSWSLPLAVALVFSATNVAFTDEGSLVNAATSDAADTMDETFDSVRAEAMEMAEVPPSAVDPSTAPVADEAAVAQGSAAVAPGSAAVAPGSEAVAPGSEALAPGSEAVAAIDDVPVEAVDVEMDRVAPAAPDPAADADSAWMDAGADTAQASEMAPIPETGVSDVRADESDVEMLEMAEGEASEPAPAVVEDGVNEWTPLTAAVPSGARAVDAQGVEGRIHVVVPRDTLWDISAAYLGTPWVWPSIWQDNDVDIQNPHLIHPGDHIWISATEMRVVTPSQALEMVAESELAPAAPSDENWDTADESAVDEALPLAMLDGSAEVAPPAAPSDASGVAPAAMSVEDSDPRFIEIGARGNMSYVSADMLDAATSIVASPSGRIFLSEGDKIVIGLGEGETSIGDRFTIFDEAVPVHGLAGRLLGYHVEVLGWAQVRELRGETAIAEIRTAVNEIERGAKLLAREEMPVRFSLKAAPSDLDGHVIYMPENRTQMAQSDYVYLDRGSIHGLEVGAEIEIYDVGGITRDQTRGTSVMTPSWTVADLVVVLVEPTSSVAFVTRSEREIVRGDQVRAPVPDVAAR